MTISMNQIPANLRVPLFYAEFDNSLANQGGAQQPYRVLMLGTKLASGTKAALEKVLVTNAEQAYTLFGAGSILADMVASFLDNNKFTELHCVALNEDAAGVKAVGSIKFVGAPTEAGTIAFQIAGRSIKVPVTLASTPASLATALAAAIVADTKNVMTAAVDGVDTAKVTITCKTKGAFGNEVRLSDSYYAGEAIPAGLTLTYVQPTGGTTNPDVDDVWPVIGDSQFILVLSPFMDAENLGKIETQLALRFGPTKMNDGYHIGCVRGTVGDLTTLGQSYNSQFNLIMGVAGPANPWKWSSAIVAQIALSASIDPARPFQTLVLSGILAPKESELFTLEERNILLENGISTYFVDAGGKVNIEVIVSTYKENSFGSPDESYKYLNTPLTLSYLRFDLKATITSKFPRHKLVKNGTRLNPGQAAVSPNDIKGELIAKYREWEGKGLVENFDLFKENLIVEINGDNPNRVDVLLPPDLVNQLIVFAAKIQFRN